MVEKWKRGGGPCTPPPTWRLELPSHQNGSENNNEFLNFPTSTKISARKLCANLWEIQPHQHTPHFRINKPATTLRRRRRRIHHRNDKVSEAHNNKLDEPPLTPSTDQAASDSSMRRRVVASLVQRHRSVERNDRALHPVSPSCYSNSIEVAPYKCAVTPTSSSDLKGMIEESRYSRKTSTELVKVLNRIWSLEKQHASNKSAVKALKMELDHSKTQVKELQRDKQMNMREMENLMKHMTVSKLVRKNKERNDLQSLEEELEDERRLRKHSESLHRKLAKELCEVKSSFSGCLRNLERERKARILLENLCDEFAKGIRDYEQEVHCLKRNFEKVQVKRNFEKVQVKENSLDRLILHISEAWLDERVQMKLAESDSDLVEKTSIVDKLGFYIETFLHAKRSVEFKKYGYTSPKEVKEIYPCQQQHSLDSFPLQDSATAPQIIAQEDSIKNEFFEPKGDKAYLESICREDSCDKSEVADNCIALKLWKTKLSASDFDKIECCTKLLEGVKENTLMAKLLEARLEGQKSRTRVNKIRTS